MRMPSIRIQEAYEKAKELIRDGSSFQDALEEAGITKPSYYTHRARDNDPAPKFKSGRRTLGSTEAPKPAHTPRKYVKKQQRIIDIPLKTQGSFKAIVLSGDAEEVLKALKELR